MSPEALHVRMPNMRMTSTKKKKRIIGEYELGRTLGEGTFGKVKYAVNTATGEAVAIKVLDKGQIQRQNMIGQIKREITILKSMERNPRVVQLREVLASAAKIYIVLELVTGGELFDEIVREKRFTENKARFYFQQLVEGLRFCHDRGVSHRDLKPENLLLDEERNLKISDFGLSALCDGHHDGGDGTSTSTSTTIMSSRAALLHTRCGTPNYVAPEVLFESGGYNGFRADVWSAGVVLYVLAAGHLPFDESTLADLFCKVREANYVVPETFSVSLRHLLSRILVSDPSKRASLDEIANHEWFQGGGTRAVLLRLRPARRQVEQVGKHDTIFVSSRSKSEVLCEMQLHLKQMCFSLSSSDDHDDCLRQHRRDDDGVGVGGSPTKMTKLRAVRPTPRGMIGLVVLVACPRERRGDSTTTTVIVRRVRGGVMEFNVLLNQLKRRLKGIIVVDETTDGGAITMPRQS